MADKKRMKRRKPHPHSTLAGAPKQRKPTTYDNIGMPLRCLECETIWNGPHKGEKVKRHSLEERAVEEEGARLGYLQPGISDGVCNKRSCIEAQHRKMTDSLRAGYGDKAVDEMVERMNQEQFAEVRRDKDTYPEGLIDDLEPPL